MRWKDTKSVDPFSGGRILSGKSFWGIGETAFGISLFIFSCFYLFGRFVPRKDLYLYTPYVSFRDTRKVSRKGFPPYPFGVRIPSGYRGIGVPGDFSRIPCTGSIPYPEKLLRVRGTTRLFCSLFDRGEKDSGRLVCSLFDRGEKDSGRLFS